MVRILHYPAPCRRPAQCRRSAQCRRPARRDPHVQGALRAEPC